MKSGAKNSRTPGSYEQERLLKVCQLLDQAGARYLVIGGMAAQLHGLIRATKDVDLLIPKDVENARKILGALKNLELGVADELTPEEVVSKPFTIICDFPRVDLILVAYSVKYDEAKKTALHKKIDEIHVPYVDLETLIKTKQTGRLQDMADIENLKKLRKRK